ncbi:hypothetical protein H4Q26_014135 [Puccinia striiformis f. sp. tritici PST-130]|nr:hypothetical protein H4Q26_014135 [Puccinia striiformis f. sp. tritici PST-130]
MFWLLEEKADITYPTSPPDTKKPPPLHLVKQFNKSYGLTLELILRRPTGGLRWFMKAISDINPKFLDSIKVTKPFKAHLLCDPEDNEELPDVSAFMIPLSQESRAVLSNIFFREEINKNRPASPELDNLNDEVCDEPDQEIKIPGEIVLCQSNGESQEFWSAMPDYNLSKVDKSLKNQPSSRRKPTVFNFLIITSSSLLDLHFGLLIKRSFIGSE